MKKLSLKNLKLEVDDLLQRNELKNILGGGYDSGGGGGGGPCIVECNSGAVIQALPNCDMDTQDQACYNQSGPSYCYGNDDRCNLLA